MKKTRYGRRSFYSRLQQYLLGSICNWQLCTESVNRGAKIKNTVKYTKGVAVAALFFYVLSIAMFTANIDK
ncbi:MAG: hypothetical protein E7641_08685 [Ruminococcaceae bacterium]|nr:hypothetical protein [Oscillospiraceae bacterium]